MAVLQERSQDRAEKSLQAVQNASARGFKVASLRHHPDRYETSPEPVRDAHEQRFKLANVVNQWVQKLAVQRREPVIRRPVVCYPTTIHFPNTANTSTSTTTFARSTWRVSVSFR